MITQGKAGVDNSLCVQVSFLSIIVLLQFDDLLVFQIVNPYFLKIGLGFAKNNLRSALNILLLSFPIQLTVLFGFERDIYANLFTLLHQ